MTPFKFTPDDFDVAKVGRPRPRLTFCELMSYLANAKLELWLEDAVKVYGVFDNKKPHCTAFTGSEQPGEDTHAALLIGVQPIEKIKCAHRLKTIDGYSNSESTAECTKCGAKLKATWSEA